MKTHECIGCGYCCVSATCSAGLEKFKNVKPCEGLRWDDSAKRHYCILCVGENQSSFFYRNYLHVGAGCCSNLNSWRREPLQDRTKTIIDKHGMIESPIPDVMQHFLMALGRQWISGDVLSLAVGQFKANLISSGYDEDTAKTYCDWSIRYIKQNKSSMTEEFMG